ncbi:hypothetical protein ACFL1X_07875 [Candidatus Hydrogenedentota bacterium]
MPGPCLLRRKRLSPMMVGAILTYDAKRVPGIIQSAQVLTGDKGYDDTRLIVKSWDTHRIKPVIDIRMTWRYDETRLTERKPPR